MLKTHVFAMLFLFTFLGGAFAPMTAPTKPAASSTVSKAKAPANFVAMSSAELATLEAADAALSEVTLAKKGEVAKADSTFTWEYLLIFAVIALGAFITLVIAK